MTDENPRDELRVELTGVMSDRISHVYGVNDTQARSVCGAYEWKTDTFDRALNTRPLEGYEEKVECGNCRKILNLGEQL